MMGRELDIGRNEIEGGPRMEEPHDRIMEGREKGGRVKDEREKKKRGRREEEDEKMRSSEGNERA